MLPEYGAPPLSLVPSSHASVQLTSPSYEPPPHVTVEETDGDGGESGGDGGSGAESGGYGGSGEGAMHTQGMSAEHAVLLLPSKLKYKDSL